MITRRNFLGVVGGGVAAAAALPIATSASPSPGVIGCDLAKAADLTVVSVVERVPVGGLGFAYVDPMATRAWSRALMREVLKQTWAPKFIAAADACESEAS